LKFFQSHRGKLFALLVIYSLGVGIVYSLPIGLTDTEWYSFYSYLDSHGATPYVDVREGYPPVGFLIYMPLYYAFENNEAAFSYGFRALNGSFLVATLYVLYLVAKSVTGQKRLKTAAYYAVLPSVVIANAYSNDVIALLPAVIAVYIMQRKKPIWCGLFLGLATLSKGFPLLLLIPALLAFTDMRDKLKVLSTTLFVLVFVSLPFLVANPFTYISTFVHHGSRGPWETVWALIDSYNSHGGFLHPYLDKFFYHFNLLEVYPASPYDQAIYSWNIDLLPRMLTVCQIGIVGILAASYEELKTKTVALSGLLYISYMLFFQGYSTQFSVSTPLYLLLATMSGTMSSLVFLVPLELSHMVQILSWNSQFFGPEFLRDAHLPLLVFAIVLRTLVFSALVVCSLRSAISLKAVTGLVKRCLGYLKLFKDKWIALALSATVIMALISSGTVYGYLGNDSSFKSWDGTLSVSKSEWQTINVDGLNKGDQVMVRLTTNTWLDSKIVPDDLTNPIERGVRNPFHLKDSFNETFLFFTAESGSYDLMLKMAHTAIPFRVTDELRDLDVDASSDGSTLRLSLTDTGLDGQDSVLRLVYPCNALVNDDFSLTFKYAITAGNVSDVLFDVFDDTDEWIYSFSATENFVLTPDTKDVCGYSNLRDDQLSLLSISMKVDDNSSAAITLEALKIYSDNKTCDVQFYAENTEDIEFEIFVERDFVSSPSYSVALILTVAFGVATVYCFYLKVKRSKPTPNRNSNLLNRQGDG
jgi:hypothetical protein